LRCATELLVNGETVARGSGAEAPLGGPAEAPPHPHPNPNPNPDPDPNPSPSSKSLPALALRATARGIQSDPSCSPNPSLSPSPSPRPIQSIGSLCFPGARVAGESSQRAWPHLGRGPPCRDGPDVQHAVETQLGLGLGGTGSGQLPLRRLPTSPYISLYLPISPYISLHLAGRRCASRGSSVPRATRCTPCS
jgi:hypothetical protein